MEFIQKAESLAGMVRLVGELEGEDGGRIQESFFLQDRGSEILSGMLDNLKNGGDAESVAQTLWVLVRLCRRAMSKSTACAANLDTIGSESGIQVIFSSLKDKHEGILSNATVAEACCWLIMVLASDSVERIERLTTGGAMDVLSLVMGHFKGSIAHPAVTEFATRACRNLASHAAAAKQLVEYGVCEHLVDIVRTYSELLESLARSSSSSSPVEGGGGGGENARQVSVAYQVLEAAMWAALNLTSDSDIAQIFASVLGLDAVLACIRVLSCVYAQREARAEEAVAVDLMSSADAAPASPSEAVVAASCLVLRNLTCKGVYSFSLILHTPIVDTIFDCMNAYPFSFDVADPCLFSLVNLAEERTMAARLMGANVGPLLMRTANTLSIHYRKIADEQLETRAQRHFRTGPIAEGVTWVLQHLSSQSRRYALQLGRMGFIDTLAAFMTEFIHKDGIVQTICDTFASMCFTVRKTEEEVSVPIRRNITRMVEAGALQVIVAGLEAHKGPVASQLSDMHEPAMVLLAKCVEEFCRISSASARASGGNGRVHPPAEGNDNARQETEKEKETEKQGGGTGQDASRTDISDAEEEDPTAAEIKHAEKILESLRVRQRPDNVFVPILTTMQEHPTNGTIARCGCQLLLDLYYVSPEERLLLQGRNLFDPAYGKAAVGGNTLQESMEAWGAEEILRLWGPPAKDKRGKDYSE